MNPDPLRGAADALRYWELRQQAMSDNLANAETPDFKGERVFAQLLEGVLCGRTHRLALTLADPPQSPAVVIGRIADLRVARDAAAQVLVDTRDGTVVAGGDVTVGPAVVSHGGLTLTVGAAEDPGQSVPGAVRVAPGARIKDVASARHAVGAPAPVIAAVFESLRRVGALAAEMRMR